MKKVFKYLLVLLAFFIVVNADSEIEFVNNAGGNYRDGFLNFIKTEDGYVAVGHSESKNEDFNFGEGAGVIVKFDKNGKKLWVNGFGNDSFDMFSDVAEVEDGYLVVGTSSSTDAGFENKGYTDAVLIKYDKNGNQKWIKNFGGKFTDSFETINIDDGIIITGLTSSIELVGLDNIGEIGFILKYDYDGNLIKQKFLTDENEPNIKSLIVTDDGYVMVGKNLNSRDEKCFIAKFDKNFEEVWFKYLEGSERRNAEFNKVIESKDGYIVVGLTTLKLGPGPYGDPGGFVGKYDKNGNLKWAIHHLFSDYWTIINDVVETNYGYIIVGSSDQENTTKKAESPGIDFWAPKSATIGYLDFDGNVIGSQEFKGSRSDVFTGIVLEEDGFTVIGLSDSKNAGFENNGSYDGIIVKYVDPNILKKKLDEKLEVLKPLIDKDDEESEKFYEDTKKNKDNYSTDELKKKIKETEELIEKLKNKVKNPDTGIIGYTVLLILFLFLSYVGLKSKKKFL